MSAGYRVMRRGRLRALVLDGYGGELERFADAGGGDGEQVLGGRVPHPLVTLSSGERVVVRRYRRGGAIRHINRETYLLGHRAFREVRVTAAAGRAGVRVPVPIAGLEWRGRLGYTAAFVTRYIHGATELASWLPGASEVVRLAVMRSVGEELGKMHAGGIAHPDLNLKNFLVKDSGVGAPLLYVIDFDRGTAFPHLVRASRAARDLRRLHRSAVKLQAPISSAGWVALRDGYGAGWPLDGPLG